MRVDKDDDGAAAEGSSFIKHDLTRGPVTAVKAMLLQFSLAQLENHGYLDRYVSSMGQDKLQHLRTLAAMDWVPVALVLEHYGACDQLCLTRAEVARIAGPVGADVERRSYVSHAKKARPDDFNLWTETPALHRMWGRLYQGGSVQVVRLGDHAWRFEQRGFPMNCFAYFRHGQLAVIESAVHSLGVVVRQHQVISYDAAIDELVMRMTWE